MIWKDLPVEIQERMLEEQILQGNEKNENVFMHDIELSKPGKGFTWFSSIEGELFWEDILIYSKIDVFYEKYPKLTKWCIKVSSQEVVDYCNIHGKMPNYNTDNTVYAHFPSYDGHCTTSRNIQESYTELTLQEFKTNILKEKAMQQLSRKTLLQAYKQFVCNTWTNELFKIINSKPLAEDDTLMDIPQSTLDLINQSASQEQKDYIKTLGINLFEDKNAFSVIPNGQLKEFSKKYLGEEFAINSGNISIESIRPDLKDRCLVVDSKFKVTLIDCPNGKTAIEITKK